jgi:hypothetical protein
MLMNGSGWSLCRRKLLSPTSGTRPHHWRGTSRSNCEPTTRDHVGHPDHIKAFANPKAADDWFKANDAEGVAFEYEIIE